MDAPERVPDRARGVDPRDAVAQLLLPQRVSVRLEETHHQHAERRVLAEQRRRAARHRGVRHLHPARLVAVALDRRPPQRGHAQLRQRTLGAQRAARGVDAPDVGRDPAGERLAEQRLVRADQPQFAQRLRELGWDRSGCGHGARIVRGAAFSAALAPLRSA
jgi:hypothetical protein